MGTIQCPKPEVKVRSRLRGGFGACYAHEPQPRNTPRMFETLTKGFRNARNRLAGVTELTEENLDQALRDVRL